MLFTANLLAVSTKKIKIKATRKETINDIKTRLTQDPIYKH